MPRYTASFTKTGADSVLQIMEIQSGATVQRTKWWAVVVKNMGTESADVTFTYVVRRTTDTGTGSALTPAPMDPQDAACRAAAKHLITVDAASFGAGTLLARWPVNNRATWQWMASDGMELVGPATNTAGNSLGVSAASTSTFAGTVYFTE